MSFWFISAYRRKGTRTSKQMFIRDNVITSSLKNVALQKHQHTLGIVRPGKSAIVQILQCQPEKGSRATLPRLRLQTQNELIVSYS